MNKYLTGYRKRGRHKGVKRLIHVCLQGSVYIYMKKATLGRKNIVVSTSFGRHTVFFSVSSLENQLLDARCGAPLSFEKAKRRGVF
jgi:hypothetical protein